MFVWKCNTYNNKGKNGCDNKQIPDDVLIQLSEGIEDEITKIIILKNNRVRFVLADGSEIIREWEINRRWTDEMKERNYYNQRRRYI